MTKDDAFRAGRVLTMSVAHSIHDTYTAFLPSLLPVLIASFTLSNTEAGLLTVFLQAPSVLQPLIGHAADHLNLRYLVILAPAVTAATMSLLGGAPGYLGLAVFLMLTGISAASLHAVGPVMVGRLSGSRLGRGMGWWMVGGELGRTLGPIVIVTALQFLTLGTTPVLMVAGFAMSFLLFILLRDMVGRPARAIDALPWRRAVRAMVPILPLLLSIIVVRAFMLSALTTYLPTFLSQEGSGLFFAGAALSILQGAGVVGALVGGSLSDRFGRRTLLIISLVSTPLMMFAFLAVSGWIRLVLLVAMGLTGLSTTPVIMAAVQESLPDNRALANGTYMGLSFLIRALVIVLLGAIADLSSLRIAFATSAVVCLLGGPVAFLVPKGASGLRLADQPR